jgi:hypothetical protein
MPSDEPSTRGNVYQYEVVPIMLTRGADQSEAGQQWATLRAGLNERGRMGFRVVAVSDGPEGRAVIMERQVDGDPESQQVSASSRTVSEAADDIALTSAEASLNPPSNPGQP